MINAKKARELSERSQDKLPEQYLEFVNDEVMKAISEGKKGVRIEYSRPQQDKIIGYMRKELENNGYRTDLHASTLFISW